MSDAPRLGRARHEVRTTAKANGWTCKFYAHEAAREQADVFTRGGPGIGEIRVAVFYTYREGIGFVGGIKDASVQGMNIPGPNRLAKVLEILRPGPDPVPAPPGRE